MILGNGYMFGESETIVCNLDTCSKLEDYIDMGVIELCMRMAETEYICNKKEELSEVSTAVRKER